MQQEKSMVNRSCAVAADRCATGQPVTRELLAAVPRGAVAK